MGGDSAWLFVSIMSSAMCDVDASIFHMVNKPVLIVDAAAVFALQVAG